MELRAEPGAAHVQGFAHNWVRVNGVEIHYVSGGRGAPLLLWHGFCESWYAWRKLLPILAKDFTVIAPDMRGFGDSEKSRFAEYDARSLMTDFHELMRHLGHERIAIAAHDMGAPAALLYAAEHPGEVRSLVYIEEPVLTSQAMAEIHAFTRDAAGRGQLWWWKFASAGELPVQLIADREREFLTSFYVNGTVDASAIEPAAIDEYLRTFSGSEGIRGALGVYRSIFDSIEQTDVLTRASKHVTVPVLGVGGASSKGDQVRRQLETVADRVTGAVIENCGHFPADEHPEDLARIISEFTLASS